MDDDLLLQVATEAAEGSKILFITSSAREADDLVSRTKRIAVDTLSEHTGKSKAEATLWLFSNSSAKKNPWRLEFTSGGWVFFYPVSDTEREMGADFDNPQVVYESGSNGYEKTYYKTWRSNNLNGAKPRLVVRSVWDRLRGD